MVRVTKHVLDTRRDRCKGEATNLGAQGRRWPIGRFFLTRTVFMRRFEGVESMGSCRANIPIPISGARIHADLFGLALGSD